MTGVPLEVWRGRGVFRSDATGLQGLFGVPAPPRQSRTMALNSPVPPAGRQRPAGFCAERLIEWVCILCIADRTPRSAGKTRDFSEVRMISFNTSGPCRPARLWQLGLHASLFIALVMTACFLSNGRRALGGASQPPAGAAGQPERGRRLYAKHCASCHGPTGRGDGQAGRDLDPQPSDLHDSDVADSSPARLFRQITRGRRPMPAFGRLMKEDERWAVVAFVKSLSGPDAGRKSP